MRDYDDFTADDVLGELNVQLSSLESKEKEGHEWNEPLDTQGTVKFSASFAEDGFADKVAAYQAAISKGLIHA